MAALVEINHLTKRFSFLTAVDDISFGVDKGEVLGFLGPNGAGKSTTMKMITGFLIPDAGNVQIGGADIVEQAVAVKKRIGYLPEGAPLYPDMTPAAFLNFVGAVRGFGGEELRKRIRDTVDKVQLTSVLEQPIGTLSKGFKRRVGIAQAILHDPEVLILDEPTDGLDPNQKHEVRGLIRNMAEDKAIILSTHILEEVDAVCNRVIIVADGKIVADGTPSQLEARSPHHNAVSLVLSNVDQRHVQQELEMLKGVVSAECVTQDSRVHCTVYPENGNSVLTAVSGIARERSWNVEELHVQRGRLDDVFRTITTKETREA
jgi:ABC-2 type transport system ATP-binding protein